MTEKHDLPTPPTVEELLDVGVRIRPGSDPASRDYDLLERYLKVPNHAMFLFTTEDIALDHYIRNHWAALDGLTGDACDIHVSLVQLAGGADVYSQFDEVRSLPGLDCLQFTDLPAIHVWSSSASITISLRRFSEEDKLRDIFRVIFSIIHKANGPILADHLDQLRQVIETDTNDWAKPNNGQQVANSIAGRDIIQVTIYGQAENSQEKKMSKSNLPNTSSKSGASLEEKGAKPTGQVIEDVLSGGKINQGSDAINESQTIRRAEATGDIVQKKAATPIMSFGWGTAKGLGIVGLVIVFIAWLAYLYFTQN